MAATRMSASLTWGVLSNLASAVESKRTISGRFLVLLWHWVTVASLFLSMTATGLPTMSLLPRTTARRPSIETPVDSSKRITPVGVHGANKGSEAREERCPMLYAWKLWGKANQVERPIRLEIENQPIDVLFGVNGLSDGSLTIGANVRAERELHEDAADRRIVVELLDHRDDLFHGRVLREGYVIEADPDLISGLGFHTNVDGGIRTGSSLDDSQLGLESGVL